MPLHPMSKLPLTILPLAIGVLLLVGCKPKVEPAQPQAPAATTPAGPAQTPTPAAAQASRPGRLPHRATPARVQEIIASGKTGFWADKTESCPGRRNRVAVLTWNVTASGAENVVLYVVGKDGKERNFGRGGPVGERQTGPWVKPDITFKLRNAADGSELGTLTIPKGASC